MGPAPTVVSMSTFGQTGFNNNNQVLFFQPKKTIKGFLCNIF